MSDGSKPIFRGWPKLRRGTEVCVFVDRCLTTSVAAGLFRLDNVTVAHMNSVYDRPEDVKDEQWIADTGAAGWVTFTQNFKMWKVENETSAILDHGARVFSLTNAELPIFSQGYVFGANFRRIRNRVKDRTGCLWRISERPPRKDLP
jgi:hypothetical protein